MQAVLLLPHPRIQHALLLATASNWFFRRVRACTIFGEGRVDGQPPTTVRKEFVPRNAHRTRSGKPYRETSVYNSPVMRSLISVKVLWIALALPALERAMPGAAVQAAAMEGASNNKELGYEVISIRPHKSFGGEAGIWFRPVGLESKSLTLAPLIAGAYGIANQSQVYGLPGWVASSSYDIQAKVDAQTADAWKNLSAVQLAKQQEPMLRTLLADRCRLKAHLETRELPVYDLVIAKSGLKMKEAPPEEEHGGYISGNEMKGSSTAIDPLVLNLAAWSGRKVVDKTGLAGKRFDFDLTWMPEDRRDADPANAGLSIFTALEEQLGLKLVPSKAPVEVLVIDHIERPTPN